MHHHDPYWKAPNGGFKSGPLVQHSKSSPLVNCPFSQGILPPQSPLPQVATWLPKLQYEHYK